MPIGEKPIINFILDDMARTSILPGERESKNENDSPCMCLNRSSRSVKVEEKLDRKE